LREHRQTPGEHRRARVGLQLRDLLLRSLGVLRVLLRDRLDLRHQHRTGLLTADRAQTERQQQQPDRDRAGNDRQSRGVRAADRFEQAGDPGDEMVRAADRRIEK
jgi:hypothetical protein